MADSRLARRFKAHPSAAAFRSARDTPWPSMTETRGIRDSTSSLPAASSMIGFPAREICVRARLGIQGRGGVGGCWEFEFVSGSRYMQMCVASRMKYTIAWDGGDGVMGDGCADAP